MWEDAKEAEVHMGEAAAYISVTESDVRMFCHDALEASHDKDYRCLAAFPPDQLYETAVHVIRTDPWGRARLEVVVGAGYDAASGTDLWLLLNKGHLQVLVPPMVDADTLRRDFTAGRPPAEVPAAGWGAYLHDAEEEDPRVPGDIAKRCPRCKATHADGRGRQAGTRRGRGDSSVPPHVGFLQAAANMRAARPAARGPARI